MTIQEMADAHVGHPEEIDEDSLITAQRESFKWGAYHALDAVEHCMKEHCNTCFLVVHNYIEQLKG